jgi:DnaJ-class molecular chaperone
LQISQAGQGPTDARGRRTDLLIRLHLLPHPKFERDGQNLLFDVQVPYTVAALGGEVTVETLAGQKRQLLVPSGIQTGQKLRLAGQGMPSLHDRAAGDAFARVRITVPRDLSTAEKQLLEQLAELRRDPIKTAPAR